jgi:hypothetical protein
MSFRQSLIKAFNVDADHTAHVVNNTHFAKIGDILQIIGSEFGRTQLAAARAARQIQLAAKGLKETCKCKDYEIIVVAHSQGTNIFYQALHKFLKKGLNDNDDIRKHISYYGNGSETFISQTAEGLKRAVNFIAPNDKIVRLNRLRTMDLSAFNIRYVIQAMPVGNGHNFDGNYSQLYGANVDPLDPALSSTTMPQ